MMKDISPGFRKKLALTIFRKYVESQSSLHELTYLFWEGTLRCNINCLHCGSDCSKDVRIADMPAKDFLAITAMIKSQYNPNNVMVVITGGEPLVRTDLEQVGLELYKQGYPWGFVTNGLLLSEKRFLRLMQSGLRSVTVSLDGFEESHNWLRGRSDAYQKALHAIKMIVKEPNIVYDVVTCVSKKNIHELDDLKRFLIEMGVTKWRVFTIDPIGRAKSDPYLLLDAEELVTVMNFLKNTRTENKIKVSYGCEGFLGSFENDVRDGFFFCRAGINIGSVLVDGSISVCPNNCKAVVQGNIYSDNFLTVWNEKYQLMRNRTWAKTGLCSNCNEFKWCLGNGLHLRDFEHDTVLMCHYKMLEKGLQK